MINVGKMPMLKHFLRYILKFVLVLCGHDLYIRVQEQLLTEQHGTPYGGWSISANHLTPESIVYSFGIGEDISFDLSLINHYGVTVHAFDPTPRSIAWAKAQSLPLQFQLHEYGIAHYDGTTKFYPPDNPEHVSHTMIARPTNADRAIEVPVHRLRTIMADLHQDHIDLLKMDIEGAEYAVLQDIVESQLNITQILVEFHHRFRGMSAHQTKQAIRLLNTNDYRLFAISPRGEEFSFIRVAE